MANVTVSSDIDMFMQAANYAAMRGLIAYGFCNGRLTTESGVPVSTSDRTAQSTIYFTPYLGNLLAIYSGSAWQVFAFSEISLTLSSLTSGKNYDVFVYSNSGTPTLDLSAAWTNDTTRADALALQDGVHVKSAATSRRYLGTIRTTGTTTTEDSAPSRFVWNAYNRVARKLLKTESTSSWSYNSSTWRQANGNSGNKIEVVCGLAQSNVTIDLFVTAQTGTNSSAEIGIGKGQTAGSDADVIFRPYNFTSGGTFGGASLSDSPLGYQYYAWTEARITGTNTANYFSGSQSNLSGLRGSLPC